MNQNLEKSIPPIRALLQRYGVVEAYLFGSAAKGKMNKSSDVDFLIKFDPTLDYIAYAENYFALLQELRILLNRDVDLVATETVQNPYFAQSIQESKFQIL